MPVLARLAVIGVSTVAAVTLLPATTVTAATVSTTHATFAGWVSASKQSGATYDPYPNDKIPLTGRCAALGHTGSVHRGCALHWGLTQGSTYTVCTTGAEAGKVGAAAYTDGVISLFFDLYAVGAPGAATFEGFAVGGTYAMHIHIDAGDACAAPAAVHTSMDLLNMGAISPDTTSPYENAMPNAFEGTLHYFG